MKSFKISFAILGLIAATTFSAFTKKEKAAHASKFANVWYQFTGTNQGQASSYTKFNPQPSDITVTCPDAITLCAILVADNGTNPTQASVNAIQSTINTALANQQDLSNVQLKP